MARLFIGGRRRPVTGRPLRRSISALVLLTVAVFGPTGPANAQTAAGSLTGLVTLEANGEPVHSAVVIVVGTGQFTLTDDEGRFEIAAVPVGSQQVLAQREHLTAERITVTIISGQTIAQDFVLGLSPIHEEVTVTAGTGERLTSFEAFNAVTSLDSFDLTKKPGASVAEVLEDEAGVAKRSFGPGSSRPIIRGFDGDRVLILQDGVRTGDLSSQSGDHGVTIDPGGLERLEVVRGPATLLYGANAIGGVVNAITPHDTLRQAVAPGLRGQVAFDTGSANAQVGGNSSVQYADGRWLIWGGGGSRRSGDYDTPIGPIENSETQLSNARAGLGFSGERAYFSLGYQVEDGRYGVPFAHQFEAHDEEPASGEAMENPHDEHIDIDQRRRAVRFDVGMRDIPSGFLDGFRVSLNYIDWEHQELETADELDRVGTSFENDTFVARAELAQRTTGPLGGTLGFWTLRRDFRSVGAEALAPPTVQQAVAAFAYEELDLGRYRVQFGGRLEHNRFDVDPRNPEAAHDDGAPLTRDRTFTGVSASAGVQADLGERSVVVANVTRAYRAPALEELYNFGPHVGNLTFEIGDPDLEREATVGLDVSVRHQSAKARASFNAYVYDIDNFVFPGLTGTEVDGLRVARFEQGDSRFVGFDASGSLRLPRGVWLSANGGFVSARLTGEDEPLPRIPPFHGSLSLDVPYQGLTVTPELVWASAQNDTFQGETATAGYATANISASYVWARAHIAHILTVSAYNMMDELYRNHSSFIKDLAPEIGRGVKVGYSLRFF